VRCTQVQVWTEGLASSPRYQYTAVYCWYHIEEPQVQ